MGPASGGTQVTVSGQNFGFSWMTVTCRFSMPAQHDTPGTVETDSRILCQSPNVTEMAGILPLNATVSVSKKNATAGGGGSFTAAFPFTYYASPTVSRVVPDESPEMGSIYSYVSGTRIQHTDWLKCRFGNPTAGDGFAVVVDATWYNQSMVGCAVPAHPTSGGQRTGVPVFVSLNGQQFHPESGSAPLFIYIPCPPGEFSKSYTLPCEKCPIGFYGPEPGAVACLVCPRNYHCSVAGGTTAFRCPENTISNEGATHRENCTCRVGAFHPTGAVGMACLDCVDLEGAVCPGGVTLPYAKGGYWNTRSAGDVKFWRCPAGQMACLGGADSSGECAPGYEGRMCSKCSFGYYKLDNLCIVCPEHAEWTLILGAAGFLVVLFLIRRYGVASTGSSTSIGIGVVYLQTVALFPDFHLKWPPVILDLLSRLVFFNINIDIASPECTLRNFDYTARFAFTMALPAIVAALLGLRFLVFFVRYAFVRRWGEAFENRYSNFCAEAKRPPGSRHCIVRVWRALRFRLSRLRYGISRSFVRLDSEKDIVGVQARRGCNAFFLCLVLFYIILGTKALEPFDCTLMADGRWSLDALPDVECWTGSHLSLFPWAVVFTIFYVIGIPVGFIFLLYRNRQRVKDPNDEAIRQLASILFVRYKPQWYWWEGVILLRKLTLVFVKLFLTNFALFQGVVGELVLLVFLVLQSYAHPFARVAMNRLEASLLTSNFLILMSGLMFFADRFSNEREKLVVTVITIIIIAGSMTVVVLFAFKEIRLMVRTLRLRRARSRTVAASNAWEWWRGRVALVKSPALLRFLENASGPRRRELEQITEFMRDSDGSLPEKLDRGVAALHRLVDDPRQLQLLTTQLLAGALNPEAGRPGIARLLAFFEDVEKSHEKLHPTSSGPKWWQRWCCCRKTPGKKADGDPTVPVETVVGDGMRRAVSGMGLLEGSALQKPAKRNVAIGVVASSEEGERADPQEAMTSVSVESASEVHLDSTSELAADLTARAFQFLRQQEWDSALPLLEEALEMSPQDAGLHVNRAAVLFHLGRKREALRALKEAQRLDSSIEAIRIYREALGKCIVPCTCGCHCRAPRLKRSKSAKVLPVSEGSAVVQASEHLGGNSEKRTVDSATSPGSERALSSPAWSDRGSPDGRPRQGSVGLRGSGSQVRLDTVVPEVDFVVPSDAEICENDMCWESDDSVEGGVQ